MQLLYCGNFEKESVISPDPEQKHSVKFRNVFHFYLDHTCIDLCHHQND